MRRGLAIALAAAAWSAIALAPAWAGAPTAKRSAADKPAAAGAAASPPAAPAPAAPPAPTPAQIAAAAEAAERARLDKLFPRPAAIEPRVEFWTRVYSEVEGSGGLIHDSESLDLVYEVLRWPRDTPDRESSQRVEAAKRRYREILLRLAAGPRTGLGPEERRVLALFPPGVSSRTLREAADDIRFQRGQADKFRAGLVRSGQWEDHIERVFRERGLPPELAALPHVESSFNPLARSHAGAAGLWQFMPSTGRRFLRIDRAADDRMDPLRSSEAAASFLRESYDMTGTWPLALTGWNHGPGGVARAVRQLGTRDIDVIIDRYESNSFGFASRNFYCEFLAALDVDRHAERYFGRLQRDPAPETETVTTDYYYRAGSLARAFGVETDLLRELNLGLRESVWSGQQLVPKGYPVRFPRVASRPAPALVLASVPANERLAQPRQEQHYKVQRGDTLAKVASRFGVDPAALARANHLRADRRLHAGQRLRIPESGGGERVAAQSASSPQWAAQGSHSAKAKKATAHASRSHKVRRGETLSSIAKRHGIPLAQLAAANNLSPKQRIRVGQVLRVPAPGS